MSLSSCSNISITISVLEHEHTYQDLTQLGALLESKADRGLMEARLRQAVVDTTTAIGKAAGVLELCRQDIYTATALYFGLPSRLK